MRRAPAGSLAWPYAPETCGGSTCCCYPRESFREGLCNHRRLFVCLSVCLFVCLFVTTITK